MIGRKELYALIEWLDERRGCAKCVPDFSEQEQADLERQVEKVLEEAKRNSRST